MTPPQSFTELATLWLATTGGHLSPNSRAAYQNSIVCAGRFIKSLDGNLAGELKAWEAQRRADLSSAAFAPELQIIKRVLNWGNEKKALSLTDCWTDIKSATIRNKTFEIPTREQFDAIVKTIREQPGGECCSDFIAFLGLSGARFHEARAVQWRDVNWLKGTILIARDGKGKTGERTVPLFDRLRELLERIKAKRGLLPIAQTDLIFDCANPAYRLDLACEALGVGHIRLHDLRHFACCEWLAIAGINEIPTLAKWAGHSPSQFQDRYANHTFESKSQELARLMK